MSSLLRNALIENLSFAVRSSPFLEIECESGEGEYQWGGVEVFVTGTTGRHPVIVSMVYRKGGRGEVEITLQKYDIDREAYVPQAGTQTEMFLPLAVRRAEQLLGL